MAEVPSQGPLTATGASEGKFPAKLKAQVSTAPVDGEAAAEAQEGQAAEIVLDGDHLATPASTPSIHHSVSTSEKGPLAPEEAGVVDQRPAEAVPVPNPIPAPSSSTAQTPVVPEPVDAPVATTSASATAAAVDDAGFPITNRTLTQEEMAKIWVQKIIDEGKVYYKMPMVHARVATEEAVLSTVVGGTVETTNKVSPGDIVVANVQGEQYAMPRANFEKRYDFKRPLPTENELLANEGFLRYQAVGKIWAHFVSSEDFAQYFASGTFVAAWGEEMIVRAGDTLAVPNPGGDEVYRIDKVAFAETYETEQARFEKEQWCIENGTGNAATVQPSKTPSP